MARNFPDIWLGRVEKKLKNTDIAPWLDGVSEIGGDVIMVGEGTDGEKCLIYIPVTEFEPDVLINNTTYPLALQAYTDDTLTVALDKYQTKVTTLSDDDTLGASYDKIDAATKSHVSAIASSKYGKAIHAIAPSAHTAATPVIKTTGAIDETGRIMLSRKDIVSLKKAFDEAQVPLAGRRLVLSPDHIADLLLQDQLFANQYYNYTSGKIANLFGFEVYENVANPLYVADTGVKKSFGAVTGAGDYMASIAFYAPNIAKKTGLTKQYYADSKANPENQTNRLNYRHYFIAIPKQARYVGALISDMAMAQPAEG
jgi:hypothetical protein